MSDLHYPIGLFEHHGEVSRAQRERWLDQLKTAPQALRDAVAGLGDEQLDTPYRPEGWTVRQVVHHLPDSHINSYVRFKWALTEDTPTLIKPYLEDRWATLPDYTAPVEISLTLLEALHARWLHLLSALPDEAFGRQFQHPESNNATSLAWSLGYYAWHGRHHIAHILALRRLRGWL
jgi:hypothetical protein